MKYLNRTTKQEPEADIQEVIVAKDGAKLEFIKKLQSGGTAVRVKTTSGKTVAAYGRKEDAYRAIESEKKADIERKKLAESNKQPTETKKVVQKPTTQSSTKPSVKQPVKQTSTPQSTTQKKTGYLGSQSNPKQLPEATVIGKAKQVEGLPSGNITASLKPKGEVNQKVIEWQNKLKSEGFDLGKVDGIWGKKTEAAYQSYLKNKQALEKVGLPQDNAPFVSARQGFPTPINAYLQKKGGVVKKPMINGKPIPNDNDENAIPYASEGGTDMNPALKKAKPTLPKKEQVPLKKPLLLKKKQTGGVVETKKKDPTGKLNYEVKKTVNGTASRIIQTNPKTMTPDTTYHHNPTGKMEDSAYGKSSDGYKAYYNKAKAAVEGEFARRATLKEKGGKVAEDKKGAKMKAKKCLKGCGCGTKLHKNGGILSTVCSCCGGICN